MSCSSRYKFRDRNLYSGCIFVEVTIFKWSLVNAGAAISSRLRWLHMIFGVVMSLMKPHTAPGKCASLIKCYKTVAIRIPKIGILYNHSLDN
jgi:hypothetical protein